MPNSSFEMFSGAGGLALGLELAGFEHLGFAEWNRHACDSLRRNYDPALVHEGDVQDLDYTSFGDVALVAGGPPCQPFSLGGKHRAFNDDRDMFPHAIQAIENLRPDAYIFENVKGLLRTSFAEYFGYIVLRLAFPDCVRREGEDWRVHSDRLRELDSSSYGGLSYQVSHQLLNAADYGTPQVRERVFLVGIRSDIGLSFEFPEPTHSKWELKRQQFGSREYWDRHGIAAPSANGATPWRQPSLYSADLKAWKTVRDAIGHLPAPNGKHEIADHIWRDGARSYPGHTGSYIDAPAKTLKAGVHGVPGGENMIRYEDGSIRYFTVHEGKILQTFPPDYFISGSWGEAMRQIGNAVPVKLAEVLGQRLRDLLQRTKNASSV